MIAAVAMLLRVKRLREERALAWVRARRDAAEAAEALLATARAAVEDSARTRPAREAAVYARIMTRVVDREAIDSASAEVAALEAAHQRLADRAARAAHTLEKRRAELAEARRAHRLAMQAIDKFEMLRDELRGEADAAAALAEEAELEELSGRRAAAS